MPKELITACKAIFEDGSIKNYNTIEQASEDTGISVSAIKIRCNKKNCKGIKFEWLDEHTKRSFRSRKNRNKGSAFEYEVVKKLKEIGYSGCITSRGESKRTDNNKIDIIDTNNELPVNIQCKNTLQTPNYFKIREQCTDKSKPFTLLWKKSGNTIALIPIEFFYKLLSKDV